MTRHLCSTIGVVVAIFNRRTLFDFVRAECRATVVDGRGIFTGVAKWKNEYGFYVINETTGEKRYVRVPRPALIDEVMRGYYRFHNCGYRHMTAEEMSAVANWEMSGNTSVTAKFKYFRELRMPYLVGFGVVNGKMLDRKLLNENNQYCIMDESIRGAFCCSVSFC